MRASVGQPAGVRLTSRTAPIASPDAVAVTRAAISSADHQSASPQPAAAVARSHLRVRMERA